jgi:threonine dehydrogenase-like Zn-dependent dehydrogenase
MRALRFDQNGLGIRDVSRPDGAGEALVRVTLAGICNTDLEIVRGYAGFQGTLGHEFVGILERAPDASLVGKRVVGEINAGCGSCALCAGGDARHCTRRTVLGIVARDGAFADFVSLPVRNLVVVPDRVSDEQAVFTEPLAAACEILDQVRIGPSHRVAVIGDGKLGQLIARVLGTTGCSLRVFGRHPEKLRLLESVGIETAVPGQTARSPEFDVVVEASGAPEGLDEALARTRPRGTIVLKSTFHAPVSLDSWRIVVDEITVVGSRCGRFQPALEILASGQVDVLPLISATFPLDRGVEAVEAASRPGVLKVLLRP